MSTVTQKVAARYMKRADDRRDFHWGKKQIERALNLLGDVVDVWGASGVESLADVYGSVQGVLNAIGNLGKAYRGLTRVRMASRRMDPKVKRQAIPLFKRAGLDGNGRFREPQDGYSKALDILGDLGIELDTVVSSHLFNRDTGTLHVDLAYKTDDPFSPESISNSVLVIAFHKLAENSFEVLAYLS